MLRHTNRYRYLIDVLQNYYPERLGAAFLVFTPLLFRAVWPAVKIWLDQVTASKVALVGAGALVLMHAGHDLEQRGGEEASSTL